MVTSIVVKVELGHVATIRDVPLPNGHTHEWMVFVKGADGMVIEHFVEKVVFWLHESYDPSECIVKSPPFQVRQSGYAGFNIFIDIHFKNKSEPRSVRFRYDMFLHLENMPPVNHTRVEILTFTNPSEDFKKRLIRAGAQATFCLSMNEEDVKKIWKCVDAVCFDVDSTLCQDEGVDSLAAFCGVGEKVKDWTNKAMSGIVTFQESLQARLDIMNPSRSTIQKFIDSHPPQLTPGVKDLITLLKSRGCAIFLVSGGMMEIIEPAAKLLEVKSENIFANRLLYYFDGEFGGFDKTCPTSRTGGKPEVVSILKAKYGFKKLVMIGDGATDLEACPPADAFIGFGGNVVRQRVKEGANWFVYSFQELIDELK